MANQLATLVAAAAACPRGPPRTPSGNVQPTAATPSAIPTHAAGSSRRARRAQNAFSETGRPSNYETALELERVASGDEYEYKKKGVFPNVDFYSGVVYQALSIPTDLFTPVFAIARVAGWLAHWLEQIQNNRIYRPEQIFVGKRDVPYTPLAQRP